MITRWQGFREQQERASLGAETSFKPLLLSPSLTSSWPKQVTWPSLESVGGHSELQHKDRGYKERENLWPSFVVYCSAKQTLYPVLCTLYKEGGLEPTGTQCFSGIQLKKKNRSYVGRPGGFLRLEISNWQLIRSRFYLSCTTFKSFFFFFLSQHLNPEILHKRDFFWKPLEKKTIWQKLPSTKYEVLFL